MDAPTSARDGRITLTLGALAVLLAGLVYLDALHNPFVYDDHLVVAENTSIRDPGNLRAVLLAHRFRPLVNLSYTLDYALWRLQPVGFHLTSVLLHMLNVGLLFRLSQRLAEDWRARASGSGVDRLSPAGFGFATAAIFAVHPMMTEAVGYVASRAEVLGATFAFGSLLAMRCALRGGGPVWIGAALALLALGLGARESVAMLPVLFLTYDRLFSGGLEARRRLWQLHLPLLTLTALAAGARIAVFLWVETQTPPVSAWRYLLIEVGVVWRYLGLLLVPVGQSIVHPVHEGAPATGSGVLLAGGALVGLSALAWCMRRRAPLVAFGVVWFLALLAPSSSLIPLNQAMAEHRVYLASAGVFLGVAAAGASLVAWLRARGRLGSALVPGTAVLAAVVLLSLLTITRNLVWADPVDLWREATRRAPELWVPYYGLGEALRARGACADAIPAYEHARALRPDEPLVYGNLGVCLMTVGRLDEANRVLADALRIDAGSARTHNNLGVLALSRHDPDQARRHFREALARDPGHVQARANLARLYEGTYGDAVEALRLCREIKRIAPAVPGVDDCIRRNADAMAERSAKP